MIAAASEIETIIEWVVGSAEDLSFQDASFDRLISQFGMMFFQYKNEAASQMFRAIRPGGHLAIAVCDSLEKTQHIGTS